MDVFLSYAPEDLAHRDVLVRHLDPLRRAGKMRLWHDGQVPIGEDRSAAVDAALNRAALVLLLVSADYLGSEDCTHPIRAALKDAAELAMEERD